MIEAHVNQQIGQSYRKNCLDDELREIPCLSYFIIQMLNMYDTALLLLMKHDIKHNLETDYHAEALIHLGYLQEIESSLEIQKDQVEHDLENPTNIDEVIYFGEEAS